MNRDTARRLEVWLSRTLGEPVRVDRTQNPGDGAAPETRALAPENWGIVATAGDGERPRRYLRIVGGEAPSGRECTRTRREEFALLRAAHDAGVRVPRPLVLCEDADVLGAPFFVTDSVGQSESENRLAGSSPDGAGNFVDSPTPGGRPNRDARRNPNRACGTEQPMPPDLRTQPDASEECGPGRCTRGSWIQLPELAAQWGRELAKLHRITPPHLGLDFLHPAPSDLPAARIDRFRRRLDAIGDPQPVLEWAMRQLERNAPKGAGTVLCHGAPRAESGVVVDGGALAVLDWQGYRWGDPYEDIGAFCAECRRHVSRHPEDGSAASRFGFLDGYREISGLDIDEDLGSYWQVMATVGHAVAALEHGYRFVAGGERSVELALAGRRVAEMEIDLLVDTDRLAMERTHA